MKRRIMYLLGRLLQLCSIGFGAYFILYIFGYMQITRIMAAFQECNILIIIAKVILHIMIMLFGFWSSLFGAILVLNIGCKIIEIYANETPDEEIHSEIKD